MISAKRAFYASVDRMPTILDPDFTGIPPGMQNAARWVLWRLTWKPDKKKGGGKWDKVPLRVDGTAASSTNSATWATFDEVSEAWHRGGFSGVGFVLGDGWAGIDLDGVRDPEAEQYTEAAVHAVGDVVNEAESYTELSPSGMGVKIFGKGTWAAGWSKKPFDGGGEVEVYGGGRYFTVTGRLECFPHVGDIQPALDMLARRYSEPTKPAPTRSPCTSSSSSTSPLIADDHELIRKAKAAKNGAKFSRLWAGDASGHGDDDSRADDALCCLLAFWTRKDADRIDRLFRQSGLMRDKWDEKRGQKTYGELTVADAIEKTTETYTPPNPPTIVMNGKPLGGAKDKPPSNSGDSGDAIQKGWGPPLPLPTMPPVPPFPVEVFPPKVADYWLAASESLRCPLDYVAVPGMTLLGAAAGRSRAAEVKSGYTDSPLFWTAVFAPPGSVKSPALRVARAPLQRSEQRWMDEHREARSIFDTEMDRHNQAMKDWKADGCNGEPPEKPARPTLRQCTLDDTTVEAAARVLSENARGICVVKDELIGFVRALNQYKGGKGADREFWLSAWAGAPAKVNRLKDHEAGPLFIPHPFAAIAGMLCPDSLAELRGENRHGDAPTDGFLDRFLLSFPDPIPAASETWRTIPEDIEQGYCNVFLDLLGMEMVPEQESPTETKYRPYFVRLSDSGRAAWEEFTSNIATKMNALELFDPFRGVLSKLRGYAVRFAALLWCVRRACWQLDPNAPIDADIMVGANALVGYFEQHAVRCLGRGWADQTSRIADRLLGWLARNPDKAGFSRTEAFQALKDKRTVRDSAALLPSFRLLTDHGYIRPLDRPENVRPGPVPECYAVNPNWTRST